MNLNGIYRAVVEDNNDPKKSGRCRVRLVGLQTGSKDSKQTSGIPTEHLIWAQPCGTNIGGISGVGASGSPSQGAHVLVCFENGNIRQPRILGTLPAISNAPSTPKYGHCDKDGTYPKYPGSDIAHENKPGAVTLKDEKGNIINLNDNILIANPTQKNSLRIDETNVAADGENITMTATTELLLLSTDKTHQISNGRFTGKYGSKMEETDGDKKSTVGGSYDVSITGVENRKASGMTWQIQGNSSINVGGESSYVSDNKTLIKSTAGNIKLEATAMNIQMKAALTLEGTGLTTSIKGDIYAKFGSNVYTEIGGGILTKIGGVIIMIG